MRICTTVILAVATVVSCNLSLLGVCGFEMTRDNVSYVDAHDDIPKGQPRIARGATVGEERALFQSDTSGLIQTAADTVRTKILSKLHATPDKMLAPNAWTDLQQMDDCVVKRYASALARNPEQLQLVMTMLSRDPDGLRNVMYLVRAFDSVQAEWRPYVGLDSPGKEHLRRYIAANKLQTLYPATLHTFQRVVEELNRRHALGLTVLRILDIGYGGFAKLAPALAIAKKSQISEVGATDLQTEMLTIWLIEDRSPDDVFGFLKLFEMDTSDLVYEKMDALYQYIALYNKHKRDNTPDVNIVAFIRQKLDNGAFALMGANAGKQNIFFDNFLSYLVQQWKDEGKPLLDIAEHLVSAGVDTSKVLASMSTGCGGVANFAQILTELAENSASNGRAKFWQDTMVWSWVYDGADLEFVYDVLDLPDVTKDGTRDSNLPYLKKFIKFKSGGHGFKSWQTVGKKLRDAGALE
ncbi:unnamed protein product [Hyaloperonospora brassicae]|uniref:RxLR effector candidate protein n=1 Tax=Hyaloperonospora brassicae TaxID=162125 RepID=A0AAV0UIZ9_HYABA|nr:unnamed protein product [Hyaloperonospora brassicae]